MFKSSHSWSWIWFHCCCIENGIHRAYISADFGNLGGHEECFPGMLHSVHTMRHQPYSCKHEYYWWESSHDIQAISRILFWEEFIISKLSSNICYFPEFVMSLHYMLILLWKSHNLSILSVLYLTPLHFALDGLRKFVATSRPVGTKLALPNPNHLLPKHKIAPRVER